MENLELINKNIAKFEAKLHITIDSLGYKGVKELLDAMDQHIITNITKKEYKPSEGFVDFCDTNIELLKEEVTRLFEEEGVEKDAKIVEKKIKKTYKNRYFIIVSNSTTKVDTI